MLNRLLKFLKHDFSGKMAKKIGGSMVASCYPWLHRVVAIRAIFIIADTDTLFTLFKHTF